MSSLAPAPFIVAQFFSKTFSTEKWESAQALKHAVWGNARSSEISQRD
jgi:hypothetical protein